MAYRTRANEQLSEFAKANPNPSATTVESGAPVGSKSAALTVGPRGPILLQDFVYLDEQAHFDREKIPERVVHAKGAGAFGEFEVTHDITKYTKAVLFNKIGKKTPMLLRCSTVGGEGGTADTIREPRGFAMKYYTEEGNYDLVGNNTPIFFIRDPTLFPGFIHTQKRNPVTHLKDPDMFWDFISLRPECIHQTLFMFSDRGIPDGHRHMNGYGSHTYRLVNAKGDVHFCKFHFKTNQGIKNLTPEDAFLITAKDPDYATRDLYDAIARGDFPSWTLHLQVLPEADAYAASWNPFDLTKVWPQKDFPLIQVGKFTLNRNPKNYFAEIEQAAFAPSHLIPGIEPSPDKMLQGRMFAYPDTQRHRLGPNYLQIPVNCPYRTRVHNYHRDGPMQVSDNQNGAPIYYPNSFNGPQQNSQHLESDIKLNGVARRYESADEDNYSQGTNFYHKVLDEAHKTRLAKNIADNLVNTIPRIQEVALQNFGKVDPRLEKEIRRFLAEVSKGGK
jgi:catalase